MSPKPELWCRITASASARQLTHNWLKITYIAYKSNFLSHEKPLLIVPSSVVLCIPVAMVLCTNNMMQSCNGLQKRHWSPYIYALDGSANWTEAEMTNASKNSLLLIIIIFSQFLYNMSPFENSQLGYIVVCELGWPLVGQKIRIFSKQIQPFDFLIQ